MNWINKNKIKSIIIVLAILIAICIAVLFLTHYFVHNDARATYWNMCGVIFQALFAFIGILFTVAMLFITWNLSKRQVELSKVQNEIAERQEKLSKAQNKIAEEQKNMTKRQINLELYSKRYEIYEAIIKYFNNLQSVEFPNEDLFTCRDKEAYELEDRHKKIYEQRWKSFRLECEKKTAEIDFLFSDKDVLEIKSILRVTINFECYFTSYNSKYKDLKKGFIEQKEKIEKAKEPLKNVFMKYLDFKEI